MAHARSAPPPPPTEVEIKLALPAAWAEHPAELARRVARSPALARLTPRHGPVFSRYFDTPDHRLRQRGAALRLRRVIDGDTTQWLQTLKIAGRSDSALSARGEWEMPVPGPALDLAALHASPWPEWDADGHLGAQLQPVFETAFERWRWVVRMPRGVAVEVALDLGQIGAGDHHEPLAEIELELLSGPPQALFALAHRLARSLPLLPLAASKAERGFALAAQHAPASRARPVAFPDQAPLAVVAQRALGEALRQFTANLHALQQHDDPECVHQARVAWRRLRSLWRLLRPALPTAPPEAPSLRRLSEELGALRDLHVALHDTLPPLQPLYVQGHTSRQREWQALRASLAAAAAPARQAVLGSLQSPATGRALLAWSHWIEALDGPLAPTTAPQDAAAGRTRRWLRRRTDRLARRLKDALDSAHPDDWAARHRARIRAKRLRYATQALKPLLPRRLQRAQRRAAQWQQRLGEQRDHLQAAQLAQDCGAAPELVGFLRGVAWAGAR